MKSEEKEAWSLCTINWCVDTHEALYTFVFLLLPASLLWSTSGGWWMGSSRASKEWCVWWFLAKISSSSDTIQTCSSTKYCSSSALSHCLCQFHKQRPASQHSTAWEESSCWLKLRGHCFNIQERGQMTGTYCEKYKISNEKETTGLCFRDAQTQISLWSHKVYHK